MPFRAPALSDSDDALFPKPKAPRLPRAFSGADAAAFTLAENNDEKQQSLPLRLEPEAAGLLALKPLVIAGADDFVVSGSMMSVPSFDAPWTELPAAFLAIAFGSNLPAYGAGDAGEAGVAGD